MAVLDALLTFSAQQALTGSSDVISSNVYNAGSAKKVFEGSGEEVKLAIQVTASGGTTPTLRARFVGADNAALDSNPIIIAETGVSAALVAADIPKLYELLLANQATAKQYYGVIWLQAGTSPTATVNAFICHTAPNNLVR